MDSIRAWWRDHRPSTRRLVQLYAALLYNAHIKGFVEGEIYQGKLKALCVPGLNCYSCPGAVGGCPLGSLQNALSAAGHRAPWYVLGILMLFGALLGRTVCGWLCPFGLIQELLHRIPTPKLRKGRFTRALSWLKYAILAALVIVLPLGYGLRHDLPLPAFCKYICPAGTLEGAVALLANPANDGLFAQLGALFTGKFVILVAIGLACVFCYRAFCRFICPLGAIYGCFNGISLAGVKVDAERCNGCGACARRCGMDVRIAGDRECISCGRCASACARGAISMKCGGLTLPEAETAKDPGETSREKRRGRLAWSAALAALALVMICVNIPFRQAAVEDGATGAAAPAVLNETGTDAAAPTVSTETASPQPTTSVAPDASAAATETADAVEGDAPEGPRAGNRLPDFATALIGGGEFRLAEHRGEVVFINLWATYCKPCVAELPYFDALRRAHPDAAVLAVHDGQIVTEQEVVEFLADKGWTLDFALDSPDMALFGLVDGSSTLPQTLVLDRRGMVIYNERRSVTYEMLEELYARADAAA